MEVIKTEKEAKEFILDHVRRFPEKHKVPDNLVNTYSGMGGHPVRYCDECKQLIERFQINKIEGLKQGMWNAYVE